MSDFNKELIIDLFKQRDALKRENEALKQRIKRLEEAGGQLMMWLGGDISDSNRKLLEDAWREAKEAKP